MRNRRESDRFASGRGASIWALSAGVIALLGVACDEYRISLRVKGTGLERTISWWSDGEPAEFSEQSSAYLAEIYGRPDQGRQHGFTGVFEGEMPPDIGGAGSFTRLTTSLGSASLYVERFRGTDDLAGLIQRSRSRIDLFLELAEGWLAGEMEPGPEAKAMQRFLRERLGPDLANLDVYGFVGQTSGNPDETWFRILQYAAERGYVELNSLPALLRILSRDDVAQMGRVLARTTATAIGVDPHAPLPESLSFLQDLDGIAASFRTHVAGDERFKSWAAAQRARGSKGSDEELVGRWFEDEAGIWGEGIGGFVFGSLFATGLDLTLELSRPPLRANGTWVESAGRVEWTNLPLPNSDEITRFVYAVWVDPDLEFQAAHFGRIVVDGDALVEYAVWQIGLDEAEAAEWDDFLGSLAPGPQLPGIVASFRFAQEKPAPGEPSDELPESHAKEVIDQILEQLEAGAPPMEEG